MRRLFLVAGALAALAAPVRGGDETLRSDLAASHVALARKLERPGLFREIRQELRLALELDPDCAAAREKLGYKREGTEWQGAPGPPRASKSELTGALLAELVSLHVDAAGKLDSAATRAATEDERRALAGLALDESHEDKGARELLAHTRKGTSWVSPLEASVREVFVKSAADARAAEPEKRAGDAALADFLQLGALDRREAATAVFLATPGAGADLAEIGRTIDSVRRAWYHFLPKEETTTSGVPDARPRPATHPHWLVLAPSEHDAFVERAVEPQRRALAKQLRSWSGWVALPGSDEKVFVYESGLAASNRLEWAALTAVKTLLIQTTPRGVAPPGFLVDGLSRFFAGRVVGKLEISFVSTKTTRSVAERGAQTFEGFRAGVRGLLALSLDGDLGRLAAKNLNELEEADPAWSLAFVEHALARRPDALRALLKRLSPDETTTQSVEKAFGAPLAALERDLRAWAREEY